MGLFVVVKGVEIDQVANCVLCKMLRTPFSTLDENGVAVNRFQNGKSSNH